MTTAEREALHLKVRGVALWIASLDGEAPGIKKSAMDTLLLAADALSQPSEPRANDSMTETWIRAVIEKVLKKY